MWLIRNKFAWIWWYACVKGVILSITDTCKDQRIQCQKGVRQLQLQPYPRATDNTNAPQHSHYLVKINVDPAWSYYAMHIIYGMPITSCQCNCPKHIQWRWFLVTSNYKASQATVTGVYIYIYIYIIICFNLKRYWIATCNWLHVYTHIFICIYAVSASMHIYDICLILWYVMHTHVQNINI